MRFGNLPTWAWRAHNFGRLVLYTCILCSYLGAPREVGALALSCAESGIPEDVAGGVADGVTDGIIDFGYEMSLDLGGAHGLAPSSQPAGPSKKLTFKYKGTTPCGGGNSRVIFWIDEHGNIWKRVIKTDTPFGWFNSDTTEQFNEQTDMDPDTDGIQPPTAEQIENLRKVLRSLTKDRVIDGGTVSGANKEEVERKARQDVRERLERMRRELDPPSTQPSNGGTTPPPLP